MKKPKEFVSNKREEIEAELLRLMRNPKCYAISTSQIECKWFHRDRILIRDSDLLWSSYYNLSNPPARSCFAAGPRRFKHIAVQASAYSHNERTLIVGWFA